MKRETTRSCRERISSEKALTKKPAVNRGSIAMSENVLIIPDDTVSISNRCYAGRNDFTEAVIPGSVTGMGVGALADCTALERIVLPAGMERIRKELFSGCAALKEITIPEGVRTIGEWAFRNCSSLEAVTIPVSVTEIAAEAFLSCPEITIYAEPGSYAEHFAHKYNIPVESINENV